MSLGITERSVGDVTILDMNGPLVGEGARLFRTTVGKLVDEGRRKILLDMTDVTYLDSAGLGELVAACLSLRDKGGNVFLSNPSAKTTRIFELIGLPTIFDVFGSEEQALRSFSSAEVAHCRCPVCGTVSKPFVLNRDHKSSASLTCVNGSCRSSFVVAASESDQQTVQITSLRIQTYEHEHFEILPGPPFTIQIVGRLSLFSSSALEKAWGALPSPRKVIFDLEKLTEIDESGRAALLRFLTTREANAKAVVSLKGLSRQGADWFPTGSPVYADLGMALTALGDISATPRWLVPVWKQ
jgi:anti-sigma B factor antagonist